MAFGMSAATNFAPLSCGAAINARSRLSRSSLAITSVAPVNSHQCLSELRPAVSLARLNLDELSDQLLSAAIGVVGHCLALRFEPKATATLRIGAHPQIAHESPACHLRRRLDCKTASRASGDFTTLRDGTNRLQGAPLPGPLAERPCRGLPLAARCDALCATR